MELWFRTSGSAYAGPEPPFFDPQDFDWAKYIMENWHTIREEMSLMIDENQNAILKPYFQDSIQFPPKNWKTESFYFWTKANRIMIGMFPKTHEIIKQVPGVVSASINLLEPGSKILPHYGDTNAIMRCHLGLQVPDDGLPACGFKVKEESRPWEDGKFLIFLDAYTHEAFNNTDQKRYILLLDVLRPEFRDRKYRISTMILGSISIYGYLGTRQAISKFENSPAFIKRFFLFFTCFYWWLFLTAQRTIFSTHLK